MINTKDKRIAIFISSFRAGGGERVMVELANRFSQRGYVVDLVVINSTGEYKKDVLPEVNIIPLNARRIALSLPSLVNYFMKYKPTHMVALDEYTHILAILAKRASFSNTKIYLRLGNIFSILHQRHIDEGRKLIPRLSKLLYKKANGVIANSKGVAEDARKVFSLDDSQIKVIANPKPIEDIRKKASEMPDHPWFKNKETPIILGVGRLRKQKDFVTLIRAFAKVADEIPSRLVIVGKGREEKELRNEISNLNLQDKVLLAGFQENPYSYMNHSDVYVLPSLWEGLPNSLLEALIVGVPTISSDCQAGPREILAPNTDINTKITKRENAEYGMLFPVGDVDELALSIKEMLNGESEKYRNVFVERAAQYDTEKIVDQYLAIFE